MAILNIEAWQAQPLRTPYGHLSLHGHHKGQPQTEPLRSIVYVEGVLMLLQLRSEFQFEDVT